MCVDWNKIETEYITSDVSYAMLADKYGIGRNTIYSKSKQGGWIKARHKYRDKTVTKTINKAMESESDKLSQLYTAADRVVAIIADVVESKENLPQIDGKVDISALRAMVTIIDKATVAMRSLYGYRSVAEQDKKEIELAKIHAATEAELGGAGGVIMLPPRMEDDTDGN